MRARHVVINVVGIKTYGVVVASKGIAFKQSYVNFGLIVQKSSIVMS
jgi:hypothetical protein